MKKRVFALLLALTMIFSLFPVNAFAVEEAPLANLEEQLIDAQESATSDTEECVEKITEEAGEETAEKPVEVPAPESGAADAALADVSSGNIESAEKPEENTAEEAAETAEATVEKTAEESAPETGDEWDAWQLFEELKDLLDEEAVDEDALKAFLEELSNEQLSALYELIEAEAFDAGETVRSFLAAELGVEFEQTPTAEVQEIPESDKEDLPEGEEELTEGDGEERTEEEELSEAEETSGEEKTSEEDETSEEAEEEGEQAEEEEATNPYANLTAEELFNIYTELQETEDEEAIEAFRGALTEEQLQTLDELIEKAEKEQHPYADLTAEELFSIYTELQEAGDEEAIEAFRSVLNEEQIQALDGLIEKAAREQKFELSAEADGIIVTLTAEPGTFGEVVAADTELYARRIADETAGEAGQIEEAVAEKRDEGTKVATSYKFDIKVLDKEGNELQPVEGKTVKVSFAVAALKNDALSVNVYHVKEQPAGLSAEELAPDDQVSGDETIVTVETDGFSYYVVEFTYGELTYVLPGSSEVKLSEILKALSIEGTVTAAEVSNPSLFIAVKDAAGDDWTVKALQPFTSTEWMKVTIGGVTYEITVTDEGVHFVPIDYPGSHDVTVEGKPVTIYCLQENYVWPEETTNFYDHTLVNPADFPYAGLLSDAEVEIMRRLIWAGYPNDALGIIHTYNEEWEWPGFDMGPEITQDAIWTLMTAWGKPGCNPNRVYDPEMAEDPYYQAVYALIDFATGSQSVAPPSGSTIVVEGSGKLSKIGHNQWSTNDLIITQPDDYNLPFTLTLPEGVTAVNEAGETITSVRKSEIFRLITDDPDKADGFTLGADAVAYYPTDVTFYVTNDTFESRPFQTMLYIEKASKSLSGSMALTTEPLGSIGVTKTVMGEGADPDDTFKFTVTLSDETINGQYGQMRFENGVATFTLASGETVYAYDLPVNITYTVEEEDYSADGYTTGSYNASGVIEDGVTADVRFINNYKAAAAKVSLSGTKTLTGNVLEGEDFSFTIIGHEDGVAKTVKNDASGNIDFGTHEFTEPGVYEYIIKEDIGDIQGMTYDSKEYRITITVADNGSGHLKATVTDGTNTVEGNPDAAFTTINFSNSYQAGSTSVILGGKKIFTGYPEDAENVPTFTFVLEGDKGEYDTQTVTGSDKYQFNSITYTAAGDHDYRVREIKGDSPGIYYDGEVYKIHVSVEDVNGQLVATVSGDSESGQDLDFGNRYQAAKTSVSLSGRKTLTGKPLENEEFSFTITGGKDGISKTVKNDADGKIDFGTHEFTEAGEYKYTVKEEVTNELSVTYDSKLYELTVTVTDDGQGQLKATVTDGTKTIAGNPNVVYDTLNFANKYVAGSTSVEFGGRKVFEHFPEGTGIEPEFSFLLRDGDARLISTAKVKVQGEYKFPSITYTEAGEYDYTVEEHKGKQAGVTYDGEVYEIHVSVKDVGAQLVATISGDSKTGQDIDFTNSYEAKAVEIPLSGTKTLIDLDTKEKLELDGQDFSFTITGLDDGLNKTVWNDANGKIDFGTHKFTKAGNYRYVVKENATEKLGMTIDSKKYEFTVTVTDDGSGQLAAAFTGDTLTGGDINFTNEYKALSTSLILGGKKTFENFPSDSKIVPVFTFTLSENGSVIDTQTVPMSGPYNFKSITYTAAGVHKYTVKETAGYQNGVTYDTEVYDITVTVADDGDGQLKATVTGDSTTGNDLDFTNSYQAKAVSLHIRGNKTLEGKELKDKEFSFTITGHDDGLKRTVYNDADGKIDFLEHSFTEAGTYSYTVKEDNTEENGVTYDSTKYDFTVTVTDSGNGQLEAAVTGDLTSASGIQFTNSYEVGSTSVTFSGSKTFNGFPEDSSIEPVFTFVLRGGDGTEIERKSVRVRGEYSFSSITYNSITYEKPGSYDYTVEEIAGDQNGVTYDGKVYRLHVDVIDQGGQLVATVSGDSTTGDDLDFTNSYQANGVDVHFSGWKTLEGRDLAADEFSFTLTGENGYTETVTNRTNGEIRFSKISYTEAGEYKYTVREDATNEESVTIDSKIYHITVNVTDDGSGQLEADISGDTSTGADLNFTNKYKAGSTYVILSGTKTFNNFPAESSIQPVFTFTLSENGEVIDSESVTMSGEYDFESITYTEEGVHNYTVAEAIGEQRGVTYDSKTYTVTVTVEDDMEGHLVATVSGDSTTGKDLNFINSYAAKAVDVHLSGMKTLEGRDLAADEFSFTLTDTTDEKNERLVETVKNHADGRIRFSALHFTEAGEYKYTVREDATNEESVTIDSKIYHITVTVTDDGLGQLKAVISGDSSTGTDLNFVNTYAAHSTYVILSGTKTFENFPEDSDIEPVFTFTLSENGEVIDSETVTMSGEYDFKSITYTEAGVHTYTVAEAIGEQRGVTYDSKTYTVTVTVEDDMKGHLVATVSGDSTTGKDLNFINSYAAKAVDVHLSGMKTLEGRDLAADEFSFKLTGEDGYTETVKNAADGSIRFSKLSFTQAGEYKYTVHEEASSEAGITTDRKIYHITVSVTDPGNGQLTAKLSGDTSTGSDLNFYNTYSTGSLEISKHVTGDQGDLNKLFTFTVTFDVPGSYPYSGSKSGTISSGGSISLKHNEYVVITGLPEGISYKVKESGNEGYRVYATGESGKISSSVMAKASFTNTKTSVPATGDNTRTMLWFSLMMAFFCGGAATLLPGRKKQKYSPRH